MVSNDSSKYTWPTLNFVEKSFSFEGARPEKGNNICPFSKNFNPKSSFLNIPKIPSEMNSEKSANRGCQKSKETSCIYIV